MFQGKAAHILILIHHEMKQGSFFTYFLLLIGLIGNLNAQEVHTFSLEESISYALDHNQALRKLDYDIAIAEKQSKSILSPGLPQVELGANVAYSFDLPQFVFPFNPITQEPTPTTLELGVPGQFGTGVNVSQLVFDGVYFIGLKASKAFVGINRSNLKINQEQHAVQVTKAYYTAVISKEMEALVSTNLNRVSKLYNDTKELYEAGLAEKIDVERLEISMNNLQLAQKQASRASALGLEALKFEIGMPMGEKLALSQNLEDFEANWEESLSIDPFDFNRRIEYQTLKEQHSLETYNKRRFQASFWPKMYANANYGWNLLWDADNSFNYITSGVGLSFSLPIFDGGRRRNQLNESKLNLLKIERDIEELENGIQLEQIKSKTSLVDAKDQLGSYQKNVNLAKRIFEISEIKYKEGVGSSLELNDAENQLKSAELNYLNALYEYLIAYTDYQKAHGHFSKYHKTL